MIKNTKHSFCFLALPWYATGIEGIHLFEKKYPTYKNLGRVNCFDYKKYGLSGEDYHALREEHEIYDSHSTNSPEWYVGEPLKTA